MSKDTKRPYNWVWGIGHEWGITIEEIESRMELICDPDHQSSVFAEMFLEKMESALNEVDDNG